MTYYNPIVRTFCRIRAALVKAGVDRRKVTPDALLEDLLPADQRIAFRRELVDKGVTTKWTAASVSPTTAESILSNFLLVVLAFGLIALFAVLTGSLIGGVLVFGVIAFLAAILIYRSAKSTALPDSAFTVQAPIPESPEYGSIGELTLRLTKCGDHKASGYRFTRNEIAFKVKRIVSEQLGIPLEQITDDLEFADFD